MTALQQAREAFSAACASDAGMSVTVPLGREMARLEEQDDAVKARHLRTKARDLRAAYDRHMAEYGREIGRKVADPIIATLVKSAANAALDFASECLTQAIACEIEAEDIEAGGFQILFDGVSTRLNAA